MTEFVIVRLDNGAHAPVSKTYADALGLKPLKRDPYASGRLASVKYPATTTAAAESGDTAATDTSKESGSK